MGSNRRRKYGDKGNAVAVNSIRSGRVRPGAEYSGRAPGEFELPDKEAVVRREGDLDAAPPRSLLALLAELPTLNEDFGPIGDSAPAPIQL